MYLQRNILRLFRCFHSFYCITLGQNKKGMKNTHLARLLGLILSLFSGLYSSGQTFPCDNGQRLYFFRDTGGANGSLACITNYTTSSPTVTTLFPMPTIHHNGLAANPADNYLYYLEMNQLKRLDASGSAVTVCTLGSSSLFGCFDYL